MFNREITELFDPILFELNSCRENIGVNGFVRLLKFCIFGELIVLLNDRTNFCEVNKNK